MLRNRSPGVIASKLKRFQAELHYSLSVEDRQLLQETIDLLHQLESSEHNDKTGEAVGVIVSNLVKFFTNDAIIKIVDQMTETLF